MEHVEQLEKNITNETLAGISIGTPVYESDGVRVYKSVVRRIIYDTDGIAFDSDAIGKSVFLSREDAEAERIRRAGS